MASLLDKDVGSEEEKDSLLHSLLLEEAIRSKLGGTTSSSSQEPIGTRIVPKPGLCLKTVTDGEEKVFINVCRSELVPCPRDVSDEELIHIIETNDAMKFRVPMSLGEPHAEVDNAGRGCTAYDIIINDKFYSLTQERPLLLNFLFTVVLEGLEQKYNLLLSRECKVLKNRKSMGSLQEQFIRQAPKPTIVEVDGSHSDARKKQPLISEVDQGVSTLVPEPKYTIIREPPEGVVEFLVMEVELPEVSSAGNILLDVGEDRVVMATRPRLYRLDVDLPFFLNTEEVGAQFNRSTKVLTVTLPVLGPAPY